MLRRESTRDSGTTPDEILAAVVDSRKKTSRHEYHQEQSLARIEQEVRQLALSSIGHDWESNDASIDILFVTSNGAGLGHVSRLLAVADQLDPDRKVELLTLSGAYRRVANHGLTVHYFPSSDAAEEIPRKWNRRFRDYFANLLRNRPARVVVFDGTWVYTGLTEVCRAMDVPLVWMQRGMWKESVDQSSAQRHDVAKVADYVIIPGDFAGAESVDTGSELEPKYVGPIVRTYVDELLSRTAACDELGLDPSENYVLLNLGGGSVSDPSSIAYSAVSFIRSNLPDATIVQVVSPLALHSTSDFGILSIARYPIMDCIKAFDFMVSAAGYNSAQEAVSLRIPTVLIPNKATKTDDQVKRARLLADQQLCLIAENVYELERAIRRLSEPDSRAELRHNSQDLPAPIGAYESSVFLEQILDKGDWINRRETIISVKGQNE